MAALLLLLLAIKPRKATSACSMLRSSSPLITPTPLSARWGGLALPLMLPAAATAGDGLVAGGGDCKKLATGAAGCGLGELFVTALLLPSAALSGLLLLLPKAGRGDGPRSCCCCCCC